MSKSKIYHEVEAYLKTRGTPDTPKRIAEQTGRGTAGNVARALGKLLGEGKLIRRETGVQNANVTYAWNPSYTEGITPGKVNTESKFTVGSEWRTRGGQQGVVTSDVDDGIFYAVVAGQEWSYRANGEWIGGKREYDLLTPWSEPKPEPKPEVSELWRLLNNYHTGGTATPLLEAIITAIEDLQKPEPTSEPDGYVWVNIYKHGADIFCSRDGADRCANKTRIARIKVAYRKGQFDE